MSRIAVRTDTQLRRELRRGLTLDVEVSNDTFLEPMWLRALDVSLGGMFIASPLVLDVGERLRTRFWPARAPEPITVEAEICRVMLNRRRSDRGPYGMGLRFVDVDRDLDRRLRRSLRGVPPPLPKWVALGLPKTRDTIVLSEHDLDVMLLDPDAYGDQWITEFDC